MMPDLPISLLPYVGNSGYTNSDLLVIVNYTIPSGTTSNTTILQHKDWILSGLTDSFLPLSGGTVSGDTIFLSGLTATTISGGTFYGDGSNLTGIPNIYNSNGFLTGNRTVELSGNTLSLKRTSNLDDSFLNGIDSSGNTLFQIRASYGLSSDPPTISPNLFIGLNTGVGANANVRTNLGFGNNIMTGITSGVRNTVVGNNAFTSLIRGSFNAAIGDNVAAVFTGATSGTLGDDNIFIGNGSALNQLTGRYNVYLGTNAREFAVSGNNNTIIGKNAGRNNVNGSGNIFLGYNAGANETGSNLLYIENSNSATPLIYGDFTNDLLRFNSKVGVNVLPNTYQFDVNGTAIVRGYLYLQPSSPSSTAVIINQNSSDGSLVWGGSNLNLNSSFGVTNIIISPTGTYNSMSGSGNTIIGRNAGNTLTTGNGNTLIGRNAGWGLTTGTGNIIIGRGDATNLPSSTSQSIHIVTDYRNNDASNMPSGYYAFIGGGYGAGTSIQDYYFGGMPFTPDTTASTISTLNFHAPSGLGTDLPGGSFRINGGRGTGNGTPGDVIFGTSTSGASSSTLQTLTSRWWVKGNTGNLGNLSSPTNNLHVTGTTNPVRFEGLQLNSTDTRIITSDSNGVIRYRNLSSFSGDYLPLSGGTVSGGTVFTSGLTANTVTINGSLHTTSTITANTGTSTVYSIPTSVYTGAFFDYTVSNPSGVRAGNIMSVWSGTTASFIETSTSDIGDTSPLTFTVGVSGSNAVLNASATTNNWVVKVIIRTI